MKTILIANRGEIAVRVMRACREMGIGTVAIYSDVDREARHVRYADRAFPLVGNAPAETYLRIDKILEIAAARRRRRHPSRLRLPRRERGLRAGVRRCRHHVHRPVARR